MEGFFPSDRTDPCESSGCRAPYNIGCRVVENQAECICPLCPDVLKPVCSNDGVQDRSLCNIRRQSCLGNKVAYSIKTGPCGRFSELVYLSPDANCFNMYHKEISSF